MSEQTTPPTEPATVESTLEANQSGSTEQTAEANASESTASGADATEQAATAADSARADAGGAAGASQAGNASSGGEEQKSQQDSSSGSSSGPKEERPRQPTYVETLERRLAETQDQLREFISAYKQVKEDKDSFKVRLEREFSKEKELMRGRLVADLVDVLDNLERSTQGAEAGWSAQDILMGMKMVQRQFMEKLQALGLQLVDPLGKPFDPNEAEALNMSMTFEEAQDNTVSRVYTKGYKLGDRVIRPARVEVARYTPAPEAQA